MEKLQRQESGVLRRILKVPTYSAVAGMRDGMRISNMKSRLARGKIEYLRRYCRGGIAMDHWRRGGVETGHNRPVCKFSDIYESCPSKITCGDRE